jgi:hypothetical protein
MDSPVKIVTAFGLPAARFSAFSLAIKRKCAASATGAYLTVKRRLRQFLKRSQAFQSMSDQQISPDNTNKSKSIFRFEIDDVSKRLKDEYKVGEKFVKWWREQK